MLERLRALTTLTAFLVYSEDPIADEVPGQWERVAEETWRVPSNTDLDELVRWLYLGGWIFYSSDEPVEPAELYSGAAPTAETIAEAVRRLLLRFVPGAVFLGGVTGTPLLTQTPGLPSLRAETRGLAVTRYEYLTAGLPAG